MPNWSTNTIAVKGKKADVIKWLKVGLTNAKTRNRSKINATLVAAQIEDFLNGTKTKLTLDDFNPMPETFKLFDTTNAMREYDAWLMRGIMDEYKRYSPKLFEREVNDAIDAYFKENHINKEELIGQQYTDKRMEAVRAKFPQYIAAYEKYCKEYREAADYQKKTYGVVGWYDWGNKYRGTKWNADLTDWEVAEQGDELILYAHCDTAWCYPQEWLATMQNRHNTLTFFCYALEESNAYNGYFCARNIDDWVENDEGLWSKAREKVEKKHGDEYDEDENWEEVDEEYNKLERRMYARFETYVETYKAA